MAMPIHSSWTAKLLRAAWDIESMLLAAGTRSPIVKTFMTPPEKNEWQHTACSKISSVCGRMGLSTSKCSPHAWYACFLIGQWALIRVHNHTAPPSQPPSALRLVTAFTQTTLLLFLF